MAYYKNCIVSYLTVIFLFCMAGSSANAATLNVIDNQLHGASGVLVGGSSYDVQFVNTCAEAYGTCDASAVLLFNEADAGLASQALLDQVFLDGVEGPFDTSPDRTFGIEDAGAGIVVTFFNIFDSDGMGRVSAVYNSLQEIFDESIPGSYWADNDTVFTESEFVYAKWTVSTVSVVPLPASLPLYGAGIAILGFIGWRRQRRAV